MKKSELQEFIKSEIISTNENFNQLQSQFEDLVQVVENIHHVGKEERDYDGVDDAAFDAVKHLIDVFGLDIDLYEAKFEVPADELSKVKSQIGPDDEIKITEDDEEAKPDKGVAKRGNKLDRAIKDLRAVEKSIKKHLAMFKDAEGVKAKEAAMKMLKKDNGIKKELTSLIKRLEGDVIK